MGTQRIVRALWLLAALVLAIPAPGLAHPLGNFSISQYSGIQIEAEAIAVRYFVDMAEIPTFQELQTRDMPADATDARVSRYLRDTGDALKAGLVLEVDGRRLALAVRSAEVIFPPGAADLPTMKMAFLMEAPLAKRHGAVEDLRYRDENFAARAGWKEIVAVGRAGSTLVESTVPERDRSRVLSDYPTDLLDAPPQARDARVRFARVSSPVVAAPHTTAPPAPSSKPGPPIATPPAEAPQTEAPPAPPPAVKANVQAASRGAFTDLITTRELTVSVVAIALLVAAALGAFHALEPGHGKTVVAAYLVGSRGTARHALILGLIVTASHTAGVYLLGGVTFYASQYVVPERLYPWVALASGLAIAALGLTLFWRRFRGGASEHAHHHHGGLGHPHGPAAHDHDHPHDHDHIHDAHAHDHGHHRGADDRRAPLVTTTRAASRCASSGLSASPAGSCPVPPRSSSS